MRIILLFILFASCKNIAYNTISKDVQPTEKHRQVIAAKCLSLFPTTPTFIKGKDSIRIDTIFNQPDTIVQKVLEKCPEAITILKPYKVVKTVTRIDTLRIENGAKIEVLNKQINELKAIHERDELSLTEAKDKIKVYKHRQVVVAVFLVLCAIYSLLRIYFR